MATVASQLILHPVVSQGVKILSTTVGRDKASRAIQFFARFYAWLLLSSNNKADAAKWNALKSHLALGRKLMRLAKPVEHLQAALRATQTTGPLGEQLTTVGRQIAYFLYLTYDAIVWAHAIKFINLSPEKAQKVNKTANRYWLTGITLSIANAALKAQRITAEISRLQHGAVDEKFSSAIDREAKLNGLHATRAATKQQFVIDALDFWIPATALGLVNLNDGIVGIFGFITSVLSLQAQWFALSGKK
ncbi:peroxisomal biogenesis factor 11 [Thelephora terrestris]|uniref:Peroxisomal biogenesis factor 11 n=1 Tax=Thelephora terrestris TaxID=56493 RepID=A0A9P6L8D7_9AGAM|nr:peroxisomal biogenesis factor 11 [Thelephora terrestris]